MPELAGTELGDLAVAAAPAPGAVTVVRARDVRRALSDAGLTADQAISFEAEDHLVDGRRSDAEVSLHVGFGWGLAKHAFVDADEGQILALLFGEAMRADAAHGA